MLSIVPSLLSNALDMIKERGKAPRQIKNKAVKLASATGL